MLYRLITSCRADDFVATDVSASSDELNAVTQNTFCAAWKTSRRTFGPALPSYVQETESGGYEVGISQL